MNIGVLWILAGLLAVTFLASGALTLAQPREKLATFGMGMGRSFSAGAVKASWSTVPPTGAWPARHRTARWRARVAPVRVPSQGRRELLHAPLSVVEGGTRRLAAQTCEPRPLFQARQTSRQLRWVP